MGVVQLIVISLRLVVLSLTGSSNVRNKKSSLRLSLQLSRFGDVLSRSYRQAWRDSFAGIVCALFMFISSISLGIIDTYVSERLVARFSMHFSPITSTAASMK